MPHDDTIGTVRYAIFVPLLEELSYIADVVKRVHGQDIKPPSKERRKYLVQIRSPTGAPEFVIIYSMNEMGNISAAAQAAATVSYDKPAYAFMVGLAGSLDPEVMRLGDVLVSDSVNAYFADKVREIDPAHEVFSNAATLPPDKVHVDERDRLFGDSFLRYRRNFVVADTSDQITFYLNNGAALPALQNAHSDDLDPDWCSTPPKIVHGCVMGVETVVDCGKFSNYLKEKDRDQSLDYYPQSDAKLGWKPNRNNWGPEKSATVDMESYGFLSAVETAKKNYSLPTKAIIVRGISDIAAHKAKIERTCGPEMRRIAAENALTVALDMINFLEKHRATPLRR